MQWLAALCVKRPVFATVLILSLTVVGVVRVHAARRRSLSEGRLPDDRRHDACSRAPRPRRSRPRSPTRSRKRSTRSAASTSCARSSSEGVSQVIITLPARQGHRRRRAGGARQGQRRPAAAAEDDSAAARRQDRSRRGARSSASRSAPNKPVRDITEFADKVLRRQLESVERRRPGARPRRPQAADQRRGSTPIGCAPTT